MKKLDLVRLINGEQYEKNNLIKGSRGIVLTIDFDCADVLFFNPHNVADYAIVSIKLVDLVVENEKLPTNLQDAILANIDKILSNRKTYFKPMRMNEYDIVELIVEDERYTKYGIHKGDRGCVMDNNAVQNYIEVDFSGIDEKGKCYGDCISVKIDDLKLVEKDD